MIGSLELVHVIVEDDMSKFCAFSWWNGVGMELEVRDPRKLQPNLESLVPWAGRKLDVREPLLWDCIFHSLFEVYVSLCFAN